jgi:hypothetical protein
LVGGELRPDGLSPTQKQEIEQNVRERVLLCSRHPHGEFRGHYRKVASGVQVDGTLKLLGRASSVGLKLVLREGAYSGTASLVPSSWGIRPFSAMLGALRLRDQVDVDVSVRAAEGADEGS